MIAVGAAACQPLAAIIEWRVDDRIQLFTVVILKDNLAAAAKIGVVLVRTSASPIV